MGHSTQYEDKKRKLSRAKKGKNEQSEVSAWRKIEDYRLLQEFRHNLEFYDDRVNIQWDDYPQ